MPLSTTDAVKDVFIEATRQSLARSLRTGDDWDRYKTILTETNTRLEAEQASYARDYRARIGEATEIILREEHGVRLDQPLPPGVEKFSDKDALQRKADARVSQDHDNRVAAIKSDEMAQYRVLTADIRARDAPEPAQSKSLDRSLNRPGPSRN